MFRAITSCCFPRIPHYCGEDDLPINVSFYHNIKSIRAVNLNCSVNFPATEPEKKAYATKAIKIACRHISMQYINDAENHGYVDLHNYATPKRLKNHIKLQIEDDFLKLLELAYERYLIHNDTLGECLSNIFENMALGKVRQRAYLLFSEDHVMAIHLKRLYNKSGALHYSVEFFDPNSTTRPITRRYENRHYLEKVRLSHLFHPYGYNKLYKKDNEYSLLIGFQDTSKVNESPRYPFFSQMTKVTPHMNIKGIFSMTILTNAYGDLKKLVDLELGLLTSTSINYQEWCARIIDILSYIPKSRGSLREIAHISDYSESTKQLLRLIKHLPNKDIFNQFLLLRTQSTSFLSRLYISGDIEVINEALELMDFFNRKQIKELLEPNNKLTLNFFLTTPCSNFSILEKSVKFIHTLEDNNDVFKILLQNTNLNAPIICLICQQNNSTLLSLISILLNRMNVDQLYSIFSCGCYWLRTPLWYACHHDNTQVVEDLLPWLTKLTPEKRLALLLQESKVNSDNSTPFYEASSKSDAEMLNTLTPMIADFSSQQIIKLLSSDLKSEKKARGFLAKFIAKKISHPSANGSLLKNNVPALIITQEYRKKLPSLITLLNQVNQNDRYTLLAAEDHEGKPALFTTLERGGIWAVEDFIPLLNVLTELQREKLIGARDKSGELYLVKVIKCSGCDSYAINRCFKLLDAFSSVFRKTIETLIHEQLTNRSLS